MSDQAPTLNTRPPADLPPPPPRPEPAPETPAPPPAPDKPPSSRPTTRAGRRAQAAATKAAKEAKPKAEKAPSASKPAPRRAPLESRLAASIASIGTGVVIAGAGTGSEALQADGLLVVQHAPNVAKALDGLAKDNPAVAVALERMLTAGAWSGVIAACAPIAIGVAANHGLLPAAVLAQLAPDQAE